MKLFRLSAITRIAIALGVVAGIAGGYARAQSISIPQVTSVSTSDLFADLVGGVPSQPGNRYATAAQINGVVGYINEGVATTGNTFPFGNSTTNLFMQPAGTLAAVTLTAAPIPGDGQMECFISTTATTSLTWNANTGQSITGAPTSGTAGVKYCMQYVAANATWYRNQ